MNTRNTLQNPPAVTVTHEWQGYVVRDPFMGPQLAIAICATLEEAIEQAQDWAEGCELPVKVNC